MKHITDTFYLFELYTSMR